MKQTLFIFLMLPLFVTGKTREPKELFQKTTDNGYFSHPERLPYNQRKHSDKEHAKMIATSYAIFHYQWRPAYHTLYHAILDFYKNEDKSAYASMNEKERQMAEATALHNFLSEKLKTVFTYSEYSSDYTRIVNYPEIYFAMGH